MKKKLIPRTYRLDEEEHEKFQEKCDNLNLGVSEVVRDFMEDSNDKGEISDKAILARNKKMKRRRI